jgi:spermidine/putrescine transport system permease protein
VRRPRLSSVAGWAVLAFLYLPVLVLAAFSLNGGKYTAHWDSVSLRWYEAIFLPSTSKEPLAAVLPGALALSLRIAVVASAAAVVLATLTALGLRGASRALALPLLALWSLPIVLPDVVLGVSWRGAFERLGMGEGLVPVLLAHATMAAAFGLVVVRSRLGTLDASLVEAARDLGASRLRATWHVVLPHLRPALASAALLAFTLSFDDFMVTFFLQPPSAPTLPIAMYGGVTRGGGPVLNALATLSLVGTFLVAWLAMRLARPADVAAR